MGLALFVGSQDYDEKFLLDELQKLLKVRGMFELAYHVYRGALSMWNKPLRISSNWLF